jgi:hypothetical protein
MFCIRLWHLPKHRWNFPVSWKVIDSLQVSCVTKEGQYWFDQLQHRKDVTRIQLTDLKTDKIQEYLAPY